MKRFLAMILALVFCLGLAACADEPVEPPAPEEPSGDYEDILALLESADYEEAIHFIESLQGDASAEEAEETGSRLIELVPRMENGSWLFEMPLENPLSGPIMLESLAITDYTDGQESDSYRFFAEELDALSVVPMSLEAGEIAAWTDGHPIVSDKHQREYRYRFSTESGGEYFITFRFDMLACAGIPEEQQTQPSGHWSFPILLENTEAIPLTLVAMDITDLMDGTALGTSIFEGEEPLSQIGLGDLTLQPGATFTWQDGHPAVSDWNGREYRFHFAEQFGGPWVLTLTFRFEDLDVQVSAPVDYSADNGQDLKTLRHEASFEIEVSDGVYWVPAASLGASRYTNAEIFAMLTASPEEKQAAISTLYEALQLYQIGNFTPSDDNIRIFENGINWEHHKPGYHAVRTNTGCCATDTNWLRYILDGDYEEVGFLATSQPDGSGHVYNYILQDGWYYFADLTHYHASGSPIDSAVENGDLAAYRATDFVLGNIHKAQSFESYVNYVQTTFHEPPALMFRYTAENVLAVDSLHGDTVQIVYEEANGQQIEVIYDDPNDHVEMVRAESPAHIPDWSSNPSYIW